MGTKLGLSAIHVTTHELQEVINHIKRRTGIDRLTFDAEPYILNLQNGLLNKRI